MNNIDYRALLVRYMAAVIDAEGISFVENGLGSHNTIEFTQHEFETLRQIEMEVSRMPINFIKAMAVLKPKFNVWLDGKQIFDVISMSDINGVKSIERYIRDEDGSLKHSGGVLLIETVIDNFEFREES